MKNLLTAILVLLSSAITFAQDHGHSHGHSHGAGGETEHLYPILGVFALLIVGGALFYFFNNKKN